tara:strand:+ start:1400 stop:1624 length:225 start_codon:yes stop_codon:yes gene_type:complete
VTIEQAKITIGSVGKLAAVTVPLFVTMGVTLHRVAAAEEEILELKTEHGIMMETLTDLRVQIAALCVATGAICG